MGWKEVLLSSLYLATLVESTSRSGRFWSINVGVETSALYSWAVSSAAVFVVVALVLSMYLIFEHLFSCLQATRGAEVLDWTDSNGSCLCCGIGNDSFSMTYIAEGIEFEIYWNTEFFELFHYNYQRINSGHGKFKLSANSLRMQFLSLLDSDAAFKCEIIRDCYEAFAMYCFERYLIACLGGEVSTIEFMECQSWVASSIPLLDQAYSYGVVEHPFPLNCFLRDWELGPDFYQAVKIGIVQYMLLKMICALLAMIFESLGVYGEGKFEWRYAYPYLAAVLNFSQTWALYCLVRFYSVTKNKLAPIKPLAKFLTFKSIIQPFDFTLLKATKLIATIVNSTISDSKYMGVAAVIHLYVFPSVPYKRGERCVRNVSVMADYASLGSPPDPEEVQESEKYSRLCISQREETETGPKLHQSVCDVVFGSGEIIVDDMMFTVSHVVEPVERGLAKVNRTFHQISEKMRQYGLHKKKSKDDSYLIPLNTWTKEFYDMHDELVEGSVSDSGLFDCKRLHYPFKRSSSRFKSR
ncbi:UNVERIFIED_CONTAM: protein LAZ11 [Sesamum radiatum]|uniref:Protein LAZ11 n=1 Tax=Sesamum radiatum TaxID=300843 RepID=A0AAW2M4L1_SESRA